MIGKERLKTGLGMSIHCQTRKDRAKKSSSSVFTLMLDKTENLIGLELDDIMELSLMNTGGGRWWILSIVALNGRIVLGKERF